MKDENSLSVRRSESNALIPKSFDDQLKFFTEIAKGANTGVRTAGDAMMLYQKAKELGIGWGNAVPHMHIVSGKSGIDIHIVKAILTKPKSGITWKHLEDNLPIYQYMGEDKAIYQENELPPNYVVVNSFNDEAVGFRVAILPTNISTDAAKPVYKKVPVDWRSTYEFTRKKKDIDDTWITVTCRGTFSWREALLAGLPLDKTGQLNPSAAWNAYRNLMINTRAFTFGAREIASDLLMGNYELTELLDFSNVNYEVKEKDGEIGNVTILDAKGNKVDKTEK